MFLALLQNNLSQRHASCDSGTVSSCCTMSPLVPCMMEVAWAPGLFQVLVACLLLGVRAGGWDSAGEGKPAAVRREGRLLPLCQTSPSVLLLTGSGCSCGQRSCAHFQPGFFSFPTLGSDSSQLSKLHDISPLL